MILVLLVHFINCFSSVLVDSYPVYHPSFMFKQGNKSHACNNVNKTSHRRLWNNALMETHVAQSHSRHRIAVRNLLLGVSLKRSHKNRKIRVQLPAVFTFGGHDSILCHSFSVCDICCWKGSVRYSQKTGYVLGNVDWNSFRHVFFSSSESMLCHQKEERRMFVQIRWIADGVFSLAFISGLFILYIYTLPAYEDCFPHWTQSFFLLLFFRQAIKLASLQNTYYKHIIILGFYLHILKVNFISTAQYHKSLICLKGFYNLYSIWHTNLRKSNRGRDPSPRTDQHWRLQSAQSGWQNYRL